jgi:hypothetical protein
MLFDFIDPFVMNDIFMFGSRTEDPSLVGKESIKFSSHGCSPLFYLCKFMIAVLFYGYSIYDNIV